MANVAVLGAGVVGLSTAINIKKLLPSARVTVIADRFNSETTSYGAGGLFRPTMKHTPGLPVELLRKWVADSWEYFSNMTLTDMAAETGCQLVPGYFFSNEILINELFGEFVYTYAKMTDTELKAMRMDKKYKHGYHVTTVITCCTRYMPWLMNKWLEHGGKVESKTIEDFSQLAGEYDVVVNCTGLRSKKLIKDDTVHPLRGHLIRVKADWIKYWMYTEDGAYIIPNGDVISIGGTREKGNYNTDIDKTDSKDVMDRCLNLWPPLKGCKVVEEWVGLRPARSPLRLEPEILKTKKGPLKIVHNYGHGSNGIALSWGTAIHAAKLVKDIVDSNSRM
ncbi:D-aspartate oxidase-like [Mytilus trossulus]|uniref:D-aspartate oxidase-like n=1 Tax=Mytilus trossulus TaxID=6551 RepID=UPI00300427BB